MGVVRLNLRSVSELVYLRYLQTGARLLVLLPLIEFLKESVPLEATLLLLNRFAIVHLLEHHRVEILTSAPVCLVKHAQQKRESVLRIHSPQKFL